MIKIEILLITSNIVMTINHIQQLLIKHSIQLQHLLTFINFHYLYNNY